jgi:hypothetical protein
MQNEQRIELLSKIKDLGFFTWRENQNGLLYPDSWETEQIIIWAETESLYFSKAFVELSKWFLEEHKLHCSIMIYMDSEWFFVIRNLKDKFNSQISLDEAWFKSIGEAQLGAIEEMAHYVSVVKNLKSE